MIVALVEFFLPFALGYSLGQGLDMTFAQSLFLGTALAVTALPLARRTLAPFGPLLWLLAWADRGLHAVVHTPRPLQPDIE